MPADVALKSRSEDLRTDFFLIFAAQPTTAAMKQTILLPLLLLLALSGLRGQTVSPADSLLTARLDSLVQALLPTGGNAGICICRCWISGIRSSFSCIRTESCRIFP